MRAQPLRGGPWAGHRGAPARASAQRLRVCGRHLWPQETLLPHRGWGLGERTVVPPAFSAPLPGAKPSPGLLTGRALQDGPHATSGQGSRPCWTPDSCAQTLAWDGPWPCTCSAHKPCPCCLQAPLPPLPPTLASLWLLSLLPLPPAPSHPALLSPLLSHLLQTMAIGIIHLLSVLGLLQLTLKVGDQPDKVTQDLIQEQEKMLREEMSWLLQEVKEGSELESGNSTPFVFLAACHHWQFWALAEVLLILFGMYWLPRQRKADTNGDSDPWSSTSEDGDVGEEEDEKVEDELMEEQEEWEEVHFNDQRDPGLLVGLLREAVLPKLLEMENIMEEMAGTNSASANSLQRSTFMSELQAEMGLFATLFENNLAISSLICSKDQLNGSPSSFH